MDPARRLDSNQPSRLHIFLALLLTLMNPAYMAPLYHTSTGHLLIFVGLGMMSIGSVLLKKLVSFKG